MQRLTHVIAIGCLAASPALLAHDEHGYWDFRFGIGAEPPLTDAAYSNSATYSEQEWETTGSSLEFNVSHRFNSEGSSSAYVTFGPFIRGFDGEEDPWTRDNGQVTLSTGGIQVGAGYSFRRGRYSLEIGPRFGFGSASATETYWSNDLESEDDGTYARFDLGATNALTFRKFQFGATVGIAAWEADVHYRSQVAFDDMGPYMTTPTDATYNGAGGYLLMFVGFR